MNTPNMQLHPVAAASDHAVGKDAPAPTSALRAFVRQWGPCILTAIVVPGGIVIALLMVWNRWNQGRLAAMTPARA